jgi:hypothetical protein
MKRLTKKNICMSSWCQVVAVCLFASQIIHLVDAQSTTDATTADSSDHTELSHSTESTEGNCPMCNLSEVSELAPLFLLRYVIQKIFLDKIYVCKMAKKNVFR